MGTSAILFAATCVFQLLFLERGASLMDEGSILALGEELSHGGILYRDYQTFVAPATYEVMGLLYRIFDPHMLVGRTFILLAFSTVVVLVHRILLHLMPAPAAAIGALAFWPIKPLAFPMWTIVNYSMVALLFQVAALWTAVCWFRTRGRGWLWATGMLVGMTLVSKQDFGAYVAIGVAVAVVFDWWIRPQRRAGELVKTLFTLGVCGAMPIVVAAAYYTAHGAGADFFQRTVLDLAGVPSAYRVSFPGFQPWSQRASELALIVFSYFPTAFVELAWGGGFNVYDSKRVVPLEIAVKTAYYLPAFAMVAIGLSAVAGWRVRSAAERSAMVLVSTTAALGYVVVFRADWTHLMNLYAVALLPVVIGLGRWSVGGRAWRVVAAGLPWLAWLGFGAVTTWAVYTVYSAPIHSARGRILATPRTAEEVRATLAYMAMEPAESRVLFMPHIALTYFLTGRPILVPNDSMLPGLVANDEDDRRLARAVEEIDLVIYNPKIVPTASVPLYGYAPRTAMLLGWQFEAETAISNTAIAMRRIAEERPPTVVDLWSAVDAGADEPFARPPSLGEVADQSSPAISRDHWMVYRVVSLQFERTGAEQCFPRRHCVGEGEALWAMPATHPEGWGVEGGSSVSYEIRASVEGDVVTLLTTGRISIDLPTPITVSLAPYAGKCLDLQFCATALEDGLHRGLAAWAEPRIILEPAQGGAGSAGS